MSAVRCSLQQQLARCPGQGMSSVQAAPAICTTLCRAPAARRGQRGQVRPPPLPRPPRFRWRSPPLRVRLAGLPLCCAWCACSTSCVLPACTLCLVGAPQHSELIAAPCCLMCPTAGKHMYLFLRKHAERLNEDVLEAGNEGEHWWFGCKYPLAVRAACRAVSDCACGWEQQKQAGGLKDPMAPDPRPLQASRSGASWGHGARATAARLRRSARTRPSTCSQSLLATCEGCWGGVEWGSRSAGNR